MLAKISGVLVAGAVLTCVSASAWAGGLYFSERGVRPLARGGAFVAGADDLGAIYYNPAGIFDSGSELLLDGSWLHFRAEYTRKSLVEQVDPNTGAVVGRYVQTYPTVDGSTPVLPVPTLAGSIRVADDWAIALGAYSPYAAIPSYPETVDGQPAPQRYGLVSMDGSLLTVAGLWAAWRPHEDWRVGLGFEALVGEFVATSVLSGCMPETWMCAPEQPSWDVLAELKVSPIIAPSANAGVKWTPHPDWRVGLAFQLPYWVRSGGAMRTRLPSSPVFERASVEGDEVDVAFEVPWSLRGGVEWRPLEELRIELDGSFEAWSMHDAITITPVDIAMRNVVGLPNPYKVGEVTMTRGFQDTGSVRLGGEYFLDLFDYIWALRAGLSFESSAIPSEYLTVMTVDMPKFTAGLGVGLNIGDARFDIVYAHVFGLTQEVDPAEAQVPILNPLTARISSPRYHNGGTYSARADILGIGMRYQFDPAPGSPAEEEERAATEEPTGDESDAGASSPPGAAAGSEPVPQNAKPVTPPVATDAPEGDESDADEPDADADPDGEGEAAEGE